MLQRQSDFPRQPQDFYATPAWPTEVLLHWVRLPSGIIWEPCCGGGAIAEVLKANGHHVVATDLEDRAMARGAGTSCSKSGCPMA